MVERAAKRQCKKDERQTEALLAKARDWNARVFDPKSVTRMATLVKECPSEQGAVTRQKQGRGAVARMPADWNSREQAHGAVPQAVGAAQG